MNTEYRLQKENELEHLLKITWERGPDLPQGFQDSDAGFIGEYLINICGFCQGKEALTMPDRYPRGFLKKVWALDVSAEKKSWIELPDFPGEARQGLSCTEVNGVLYCWGGFSYTEPFCYTDGYRLLFHNGQWVWEELPPLPWPLAFAGICSIGSRIYLSGGSDYDCEHFYTWSDRKRAVERLGTQLMVFDTEEASSGWRTISSIPGTPRTLHAMAAIDNNLYIIGGVAGEDRPWLKDSYGSLASVVDNWKFNCITNCWTRLPDIPISTATFPDNKIVFENRYIMLIGGFQYDECFNADESVGEKYGTASRFNNVFGYFNDMLVYDTVKNIFGRADSLPLNNLAPTAVLRGNELYLLGGETGSSTIEGRFYGHHPDLCLIGKIEERSDVSCK